MATPQAPEPLEAAALPIWAVHQAARRLTLDWNFRARLTPAQKTLLDMFVQLSFAAQSELTHGVADSESIPGAKIKMLYDQEQRQKQKGADADALKDDTESDVA
jgi:hypothetical protein